MCVCEWVVGSQNKTVCVHKSGCQKLYLDTEFYWYRCGSDDASVISICRVRLVR